LTSERAGVPDKRDSPIIVPTDVSRLEAPRFAYSSRQAGDGGRVVGASTRCREEEIVRKLRVLLMVAAFGFAALAPAMAHAQAEPPGWGGGAASWGTVAERVLGWLGGLWSTVAGSETEAPPPEEDDAGEPDFGVVLELPNIPENHNDSYPGLDPDG
jgi:hypothetical protein